MATVIRTATFSKRARGLLPESEIALLEGSIAADPSAHPVVSGTGGVRKARWRRPGIGKRGSVRAIYYLLVRSDLIYMLDLYAKNDKSDLTAADKRELRKLVSTLEDFSDDPG